MNKDDCDFEEIKEYTDSLDAYEYCLNVGMRSGGKTLMLKGLLYTKLSEELGCPLEVVFKALIDGVYIEVEHLPDIIERPRLYYSDDFKCYCLEMLYGEYVVKLKDHGKTWWLKGEKNE